MTANDHGSTCCQRVGTHDGGPWDGHPKPCGKSSSSRHPATEQYDGICQWHMRIWLAKPFPASQIAPLGHSIGFGEES